MNQKMTWDLYSTAMLLDAYLQIQESPTLRSKLLYDLSQFLRKQVRASDLAGSPYGTMADINQKFGKMEFLMTKGERGIPGKPFPFMEELVRIYETDIDRYHLYLQAARENKSIETLEKEVAKKIEVKRKPEVIATVEVTKKTEKKVESSNPIQEILDIPYDYQDIPIERLPLSNRVLNALHRNEIHTIGAFEGCTEEIFENMHNIGRKSISEMLAVLERLHYTLAVIGKSSEEKNIFNDFDQTLGNSKVADKVKKWIALGLTLQTNIRDFPMSVRTRNILHSQGIVTIGDLQKMPLEAWHQVHRCGYKSFEEIQDIYDFVLSFEDANKAISTGSNQKNVEQIRDMLQPLLGTHTNIVLNAIPNGELTEEAILHYIWSDSICQIAIETRLLAYIQLKSFCSLQQLQSMIPDNIFIPSAFQKMIERLVEKKRISVNGDVVEFRYMTLDNFIKTISKENYKRAFLGRLQGETFEETGKALHITRSRVQQLIQKVLAHRPKLEEDKYLPLWDKYVYLKDSDYQEIFGLSTEALNYYQTISKSHYKLPKRKNARLECLQQILHDYVGNKEIEVKANTVLKKLSPVFLIDGERVNRSRPDLVRYAVYKYCQDAISVDELVAKYEKLLIALGVNGDTKFTIGNQRAFGSHLENSPYLLWSRGGKLRYYDISAIDEDALLEEIGFFSYKDVEISTRKFFMDHPEAMEEYDIRDEYEMHNFLKKIWDMEKINDRLDSHHQITFGRMPIITIGQGDRDKQVLDLIKNNSPIKVHDLAEKYEETYGVNINSVLANFFDCAAKYLNQDTYSVHWKSLPDNIMCQMKERLTDDFYFLDEVQDIFMDEFPEENVWLLNTFTLSELGFLTYSNYVIRNTYSSAAAYFKHLISGKCVDLRDKSYLTSIGTFYSLMMRERGAFQIVEVEPLMYVNIDYLNEQGITKEQLYDFWKLIENTVEDGEFFTIYSLKKRGISLPWQDMYFKNWFYSSVLLEDKAHFTYKRYAACRLFRKSTKQFSLGDFLLDVIHKTGRDFEIHELMHFLRDTYGFCPKDDKIKEVVASDYELSEKIIVY